MTNNLPSEREGKIVNFNLGKKLYRFQDSLLPKFGNHQKASEALKDAINNTISSPMTEPRPTMADLKASEEKASWTIPIAELS